MNDEIIQYLEEVTDNMPSRGPEGSFQNQVRQYILTFGPDDVKVTPEMEIDHE